MIFYWNDLKCETVGPLQGLLPHLLVLFGCLIWANHQQTTVLHLGNTSRPTAMYMNLVNLYFYMVIPLKSRGDYYKFPTVWIVAVVRCRSYFSWQRCYHGFQTDIFLSVKQWLLFWSFWDIGNLSSFCDCITYMLWLLLSFVFHYYSALHCESIKSILFSIGILGTSVKSSFCVQKD